MEPGTAHPLQRLKAVRALTRAGVRAGVLMAPLVPGVTTSRHGIEATLTAIADHGASFVGANVLHLEGGTRDHFFNFLERTYPHLMDGYRRLYANGAKRVPKAYAQAVRDAVDEAREQAGMSGRGKIDGGRDRSDEDDDDRSDMRPEARDPVLWEAAVMET
jgi:DNA repair photolyase